MLKRLANKATMYQVVQCLLNSNKTVWESVPAMAAAVATFEDLLASIETYKLITYETQKGITLQKAQQQEQVIAHTYELVSVMFAMANQTNDAVLAGMVDYTETGLLKTRDTQLVAVCMSIAELATGHLAGLAAYGVTESEILTLKEEIMQFSDNLPTTRISVSERKAANEKLRDLFVQVDALLKKQLDRLMVRQRQTQPDFYAAYQNARRIINYGIRHEKTKEPENPEQGVVN